MVLSVPETLAQGRYIVERPLGEGARKQVYLARDNHLDRPVAIAILKTEGLGPPSVERLRREIRAMTRLGDHPYVVSVFDAGDLEGVPYIVTEYMAGGDLGQHIRASNCLSLDEVLRIGKQVCEALGYAHSRGYVHRDVKPGNVWLTERGDAKIGDFGLARAMDDESVTKRGHIVGTAYYLPPEVAAGSPFDARGDWYSFGVTLYQMVTGRLPFVGDSVASIISQHLNVEPVAPSRHNDSLPPSVDELILALLRKEPDQRLSSAHAVAEVLGEVEFQTQTVESGSGDQPNPLDRLAPGVFVGREPEMAQLRRCVDHAMSGRGQIALVAGEPGMGKTRIAQQLSVYAQLRGALVLWGRCFEEGGAPGYWPWIQIVRSYVTARGIESARAMLPQAPLIGQFIPELRGEPPAAAAASEPSRVELFDQVSAFLMRQASRECPLLLIVDDLQWSDESSLLLLEFLASELDASRILVLGIFRDLDIPSGDGGPLRRTLARLAQHPRTTRVDLRGLAEAEIATYVAMTTGQKSPPGLVAAILSATGGNPFFVQETVRLLASDGRLEEASRSATWDIEVPAGARDLVSRRLGSVSDACASLLSVASALGREFDAAIPAQATNQPLDDTLRTLDEAVRARLLVEVANEPRHYAFSHELVRKALYERLGRAARSSLHLRLGETIERITGDEPDALPELAYHYSEAAPTGDLDKAQRYVREAAQQAMDALAYEEAARLYERACTIARLRIPVDREGLQESTFAQAQALTRAGLLDEARVAYRAACGMARSLGLAEAFCHAALGYAGPWVGAGFGAQDVIELLREAIDILGEGDPALRSRLLARFAVEQYYEPQHESRADLSARAVELARSTGDLSAVAYALNAQYYAIWGPNSAQQRIDVAQEMLEVAEEAQAVELILQARHLRALGMLELGRMADLDAELAAYDELAEGLGQPIHRYRTAARKAMRALLDGRYGDAEQAAREAHAIGQRAGDPNAPLEFAVHLFSVRREQGRLSELADGTRQLERRYSLPALRCASVRILCEATDLPAARAALEELVRDGCAQIPQDANWLASLTLLAEACEYLRDVDRAAQLYDLMKPYENQHVVIGAGAASRGSSSLYLGMLAAVGGDTETARKHFQDALEMHQRLGSRPWVAQAQAALARTLTESEPERAADLLREASATAEELGMKSLSATLSAADGPDPPSKSRSIEALATTISVERPDLSRYADGAETIAILFTDIADSVALNERLGDATWVLLIRKHNDAVRKQIGAFGGEEVANRGDGFMVVFPDVRRAVGCARAMQRESEAVGRSEVGEPVRLHIGIHVGRPVRDVGTFYGRDVNIAARLADYVAGPGEIVVSSAAIEQLGQEEGLEIGPERRVKLKGIERAQTVFAVR